MQDGTFDAVEYLPPVHAVHVVAPVPVPVLVMDPALQSVQDGTFDAVENLPPVHAVHVVAPVSVPVSVMDPALHILQLVALVTQMSGWYLPSTQCVQLLQSGLPHVAPLPHWEHVAVALTTQNASARVNLAAYNDGI